MPLPRVLVLHNEPTLPPGHPDAESETDILETADVVCRILRQVGLNPTRLGITDELDPLVAGIRSAAPDVVFNLYEGTAGWGNAEVHVAGVLELLRLPYTGCPTQPLLLCRSKPLTKRLLAGSGLPTPPFLLIEDGVVPACPLPWPVMVKPAAEDGSVGIDQNSVATNQRQLEDRVAYLRERYGPGVLVERFIRGREFQVAVIDRGGLAVLPFTEILFVPPADAPDLWPIVSFDAKWRETSREFIATPARNPAEDVPARVHAAVADVARRAFELVGCRDYARIDFRVDAGGNPYVLEVNPNPCISEVGGVGVALVSAKVPYPEFILGLVRNALRRGPRPKLADAVGAAVPSPVTEINSRASNADGRFTVRPAGEADRDAIASLIETADGWSADERATAARRVAGQSERADRDRQCLVLACGAEVVGVAAVRPADAFGAFDLEFLTVAPPHRRAGNGRLLLRAVEAAVARAGGRAVLAAVTSAPSFAAARQFLSRAGYQSAGEVPEFSDYVYSRLAFARPVATAAAATTASAATAAS